jgi:hypothetical protein
MRSRHTSMSMMNYSVPALAAGLLCSVCWMSPALAQTAPSAAAPGNPAPAAKPAAAKPAENKAAIAQAAAPGAPKSVPAAATPTAPPSKVAQPADTTVPPAAAAGGPTKAAPAPDKAATGPAIAAKPDPKAQKGAKKALADGEKAYKTADFATALTRFEESEALLPSAAAEYWIADCLDKLGRLDEALPAYNRFLANPTQDKTLADKRTTAEARVAQLKATVPGEINVITKPEHASVMVDGQAQPGQTPMPLKLSPGEHKIVVTAPGYEPREITVVASAAVKGEQKVDLVEIPPPPPAPPPPPPPASAPPPPAPPPAPPSMTPAYVTLGVAGVATVVGTYFGIRALSAKSDYNDHPTSDKADKVENSALVADMAFGVAITLGVTGIVLLTSPEEPAATPTAKAVDQKPKLRVSPWATPKSGGLGALVTF